MTPDWHEWRLITRAAAGNAAAFGDLFHRYLDASYRYFYFRVDSVAVAEQLTDRLFVRAWERLPYDSELAGLPFKLWLLQLANELVVDYNLASKRETKQRPPLVAWSSQIESSKLPHLHPHILAGAIRHLEPLAQQVIVLRFVLRLAPKEVSLVIGDTVQGASVLQYRALAALYGVLTRQRVRDDLFKGQHIDATNFCLDHIVDDTLSVEKCLQHLEDYNQQLKQTLQLAKMVTGARRVQPRRTFQQEARARIERNIRKSRRSPVDGSIWRTFAGQSLASIPSPLLVILGALLIVVPLTAFGLGAIDRLTPSSRAYRLDLGMEQLYLATLRDTQEIGDYRVSLTEERLQEARLAASTGDLQSLQTALLAYTVQISALSQTVQTAESDALAASYNEVFSRQERQLTEIMTQALPADARNQLATFSCPQATGSSIGHPAGLTLLVQDSAMREELQRSMCEGHSFGEIVLALATVQSRVATGQGDDGLRAVSAVQTLERKRDAGGWGQLWWMMGNEATNIQGE
ncbi:MAG: hypothetical protein ACOC9C_03160 [Chloroflexota bacterium]